MRIRWEPLFNKWVSAMQQGFLRGRSMLSNVVDVDYEAMTISLKHPYGALILFDFQAAFPSLAHDYLHEVLCHLGLPGESLNFIKALYDCNRCVISCQGGRAGIRQGCPLSPLLFVVVVDMLLRKLAKLVPGSLIRAFADDTAMVMEDFWKSAELVHGTFREFGRISGLNLNIPKTTMIPLWTTPLAIIKNEVQWRCPSWAGVEVAGSGAYIEVC
jgi:hypothetical protein